MDYRRKWCEKIGLGFVLPTNVSQLSQPKPADRFKESSMKLVNLRGIKWSGRMDLNHRPPGPEEGGIKHLSAASGVAYGTPRPFTLLLKWTEVGRKRAAQTTSAMDADRLLIVQFLTALTGRLREQEFETRFAGVAKRWIFDASQVGMPGVLACLCRIAVIHRPRFLISAAYLLPLTAAFLVIAVAALAFRASNRRGYGPFVCGLIAGSFVLAGKFAWSSNLTTYSALGLLVIASVWNAWPFREAATCPGCQKV